MTDSAPSFTRCLAVWLVVAGSSGSAVAAVAGELRPDTGAFDTVVVAGAAWALCLAAAWTTLVTGVVAIQVARDARIPQRGVPAPLRGLLLRACGAALAGGLVSGMAAAPAQAAPLSGSDGSVVQPAPPAGPVSARSAGHRPTAGTTATTTRFTTRPGDSLWRVAEARLRAVTGREPSDAEVAAYWPRVHATNRVLIGPDPDFVLPGVPLVLPATVHEKELS